MKKLSLKVLSAGVAAFVALSSLPLASLTSSAYIHDQASNAGTPYNWVMTSRSGDTSTFGTMGDREVYISAEDIAAGDVSVPLNIYFDSTEWDELCGIASIRLSWATTKDATLADGGVVADDVYYVDLQSIDNTTTQGTKTYTATDGTEYTVNNTTTANLWCFTSLGSMMGMSTIRSQGGYNIDTNTWNSLSDTAGTYIITTEEVICDRIFGSDIYRSDKDGYVAFDIAYLQSADEKGTGIKHYETIECEVLYKSDGTPYITYDYTRQDNYQTDTMTMDLPYYTPTRFVSRDDGKEYVPAANNMFSFITSACSLGSEYVGGDSMSFPVVGMTAVFPQGTPEGTYYVQVSTEDVYGNQYPVATESQFEEMRQKEEAATSGYDLSTEIITYDYEVALAQDSTLDTDYVKVVIGEESETTSPQTSQQTSQQTTSTTPEETEAETTTKAPEGDEIYWNIDKVTVNAGDVATIGVTVQAADGIDASSWGVKGSLFFSKASAALFGSSNYYINQLFGNINEFDTASLTSAAANGTSADVRFGMAISSSTAADPTNGLFEIVIQTPDESTVASVAAANGISMQYSSSIGYYYEFPIAWSDRNLSVTGNSGGTSVTMPSFEYRDSSGTYGEDIFDQVILNDGYLRIAVSGESTSTDTGTTSPSTGNTSDNTTSSSSNTDDYDIWIDISETRVSPETAAIVEVMVDSKDGVDASSYGVKGGMVINSATMDLMRGGQSYLTAHNMSDPEYLFVPQFGSISAFNESEIQAGLNGTSGDALVLYELAASVASDPSGTDLFQMYVCIPDEDTVVSIAQSNGLTLQYDSTTGEYYYEFPITWSDRNATDSGYSGTTLVTMDRFQYMDASGNGGTNIMDRVGLYDGSIQVVVSGSSSSTTSSTNATTSNTTGSTSTSVDEDYDIWMVIENERVYPDNLAMVDITVEADDSVNARSYGFKGSFTFDDALVDVLRSYQSNNPGNDVYLLQANYGQINSFNTQALDALLAGTSTDACSIIMAQVTTVPTDPRNSSVATLNLCITDEQSVIDIANAYGMQLYYDATTDEYYYEFPITWDDRNLTDTGISGNQTVTMTRFQYFNDAGTSGENIIDEVGFIDGSVQIVISGKNAETADPPAVTTDGSGDTGSGDTGSGDTGSGDTGSGDTGSGDTGSGDTGSGDTGSGDTGSGDTGSGDTGSGDTGSGDTGSGDTGSGDTGSGDTGSGDTGSGDTGSGDTGSGDTGSGDTGSGDTGSGDTGSGDTGSGDTGSGDTGSGDTGSGDTGSGDTGSGDTGSGDTGSGDTGSGDTGSGDTGSGDTGSGDTGSGDTGSGDTGSGDTGSGDTGSGDTGSGDTGSGDGSGDTGETVADPSDITWSLDKMDVQASSKTKTIEYNVNVANAIESSGFQGELYLPAETLALLTLNDVSMDDSVYSTFDAEYYQNKNYIAFSGVSSKVVKPSDTDGILITFEFTIPSEEDVIAIALEYDMQLKSNATGAYYQFAVEWCDDEEEFAYLDAANRDAFSQFDAVDLVDGYIRVYVDEDLVDAMGGGSAEDETSENSGDEETSVEETSVEETSVEETSVEETSVEETSVEEETSAVESTELEIVFEPATFEADSDNDGTTEVYGVGFYFSADLAEFNPADLVSVATVNGEDVIGDITFEYDTPKELFDAVSNGAAYIVYDMTAYYGEIELGTVTIYSAIKGDVNFSGAVDPNDGYDTLVYYSTYSLYGKASFTSNGGELELLAHFVADIDTELTDGTIDPNDSYYMLTYYAQNSLTGSAMWNSTVSSLKDRTY